MSEVIRKVSDHCIMLEKRCNLKSPKPVKSKEPLAGPILIAKGMVLGRLELMEACCGHAALTRSNLETIGSGPLEIWSYQKRRTRSGKSEAVLRSHVTVGAPYSTA